MTAIPSHLAGQDIKSSINISYPMDNEGKPVFTPIKLGSGGRVRGGHRGSEYQPESFSSMSSMFPTNSILTPAQLEDQGLIFGKLIHHMI